jgi:replicative DNA helicase
LKGLDEFTHGAFNGELTIVSGESGGGKTAYILQMLIANALEGTPCCLFSMEMTKEQVKKRCYPLLSNVLTSNHIRDPRLMNLHTHVPEMKNVTQELARLPIYIDDTRQLRIDKLISRMRMLRRKMGIKLYAVDYLQLLEGMPGVSEATAFKKTMFALRDFPALEPDCTLVVLSQYSKADGFTKSKKRTRDSLYGGSVIQHAAQNIIMITIEDPEKRDENDLLDAEFRIAKQRDGKRGKITCVFDRDHYKFTYMTPALRGT